MRSFVANMLNDLRGGSRRTGAQEGAGVSVGAGDSRSRSTSRSMLANLFIANIGGTRESPILSRFGSGSSMRSFVVHLFDDITGGSGSMEWEHEFEYVCVLFLRPVVRSM